jgi:hypothetical protein
MPVFLIPQGGDPEKLPPCGMVDTVTGAVCTLQHTHRVHRDETDWGVILEFGDGPKPIIVP